MSKKYEVPAETARNIDERIAELVKYTGKSESEILELLKTAMNDRNREWEFLSQESALSFHRNSEANIYCLTKWNNEDKYQEITNYINFICRQKGGDILDFAGGIGDLSIKLASNNLHVDFLEVPGKSLAFAKWRFKRNFLDLKIFTSLNQVDKYDIIIALDVLEVLEKPYAHLRKFYQLLNENGLLITSLGKVGDYEHPMNLKSNAEFLENFDYHCRELGFRDSEYDNIFHLKLKQK